MKRAACLVVLCLFAGCVRSTDAIPVDPPMDKAELVKNNTQFAFDLHAAFADETANLFYSPFSISTALGSAYAGARGSTAEEMAKTLHFPKEQDRLPREFARLRDSIRSSQGKGIEIDMNNGLWVQKDYPLQPSFLQSMKATDGAPHEVDFANDVVVARRAINESIDKSTRGKIKEILGPGDLDASTRVVLTNAIYFKGDWLRTFPEKGTRQAFFYRKPGDGVQVPMMSQLAAFPYLSTDSFQAVQLPYAGKQLSMILFAPTRADGLFEFEKTLTPEKLTSHLSQMTAQEINVFLPRFKIRYRADLKERLISLGMRQAFEAGKADFSGMVVKEKVHIAKVIHEAFVEVNESGTEAAGATVIETAKSAGGGPVVREPPSFRADRPFLFLIRHDATGSILFAGRMVDPTR